MYSSFLLCLRRYARCFDFHVSLNFVVDNSFRHVFERDAVVRPLCPVANPLCGCFCLGSCPFCVSGLLFFFDETQIWLGDLRVVWLVCVILVCCDLPAFSDLLGLCTNDVFTAYVHVRTKPQCDIGHTRGKKKSSIRQSHLAHHMLPPCQPWGDFAGTLQVYSQLSCRTPLAATCLALLPSQHIVCLDPSSGRSWILLRCDSVLLLLRTGEWFPGGSLFGRKLTPVTRGDTRCGDHGLPVLGW